MVKQDLSSSERGRMRLSNFAEVTQQARSRGGMALHLSSLTMAFPPGLTVGVAEALACRRGLQRKEWVLLRRGPHGPGRK